MSPRQLIPLAFTAVLLAGCRSATQNSVPATQHYVEIRVESVAQGGGVKVNGTLVSQLPGYVYLEVDEGGAVYRPYTIALSTNIIAGAEYALNPGQYPPARIYFDRARTITTGVARVVSMDSLPTDDFD